MLERKLSILQDVLGSCKRENKNQFLFFCPACNHYKPKLAVNIDKGACKCWICDLRYKNIFGLIKKYGTPENIREWRQIEGITDFSDLEYFHHVVNDAPKKQKLVLPDEFKSLVSDKLSVEGQIAKNYLLKRGISEADISFYKMGYATSGDFKDRVIIPSFNESGYLNYFIARSYSEDKLKYLYPRVNHKEIIVNELLVDWSEPIILVEGVFDALKAGFQAIPILGSVLKPESKLFQKIVKHGCKVFICLDRDARDKEIKIVKNLLEYNIEVEKISIDEYFKDVGEMTKEEFTNAKENDSFLLTTDRLMRYTMSKE
ncbi:MAG: hypothetical protein Q8P81_02225 [Nanoarchaeota archaeon]|nr:hypothetical protein [Nanoarchaeota archaeon]